MKKSLVCAIVVALVSFAVATPSAQAVAVLLGIDSSQSTIELKIGAIGGSATGAVITTVSGSVSSDIGLGPVGADFYTNLLQILSTDANLTDGSLTVSLGFLGGVQAALFGVGANFAGGPFAPTSLGAPGVSLYDPGGTIATLDQGFITYKGSGAVGGILGSGTFNFVTDPTSVEIPSAPNSVQVLLAQNSGPKGITLIIPISSTSTITTDPVDVTATLTGVIVATGVIVPEPATLGLLALGVCGLIPVIRRKFRKSA